MQWTTRLDLAIFISVPWGRVSLIPYASAISSDAHKDQLLLPFRYHSVTPLYSPGRKVSPRARNDTKKGVILTTASSIHHHPRPLRESRQPILKINGLINKQINSLSPGKIGERLPGHRSFTVVALCCLPYLEIAQGESTWWPRRVPHEAHHDIFRNRSPSSTWCNAHLCCCCAASPKADLQHYCDNSLPPPHSKVTSGRDCSWNHSYEKLLCVRSIKTHGCLFPPQILHSHFCFSLIKIPLTSTSANSEVSVHIM